MVSAAPATIRSISLGFPSALYASADGRALCRNPSDPETWASRPVTSRPARRQRFAPDLPMSQIDLTCTERKPGPHPAGRQCAKRGCITVLSRYNPGPRCQTHETPADRRLHPNALTHEDFADLMAA